MPTNRSYPDISFVETDTETIANALIRGYETFTGRTLYPADPARLFILWVADIIVQERVNIDFSAKQNVPRYAEGEYLDSLAELFKDDFALYPVNRTGRADDHSGGNPRHTGRGNCVCHDGGPDDSSGQAVRRRGSGVRTGRRNWKRVHSGADQTTH